MMPLKRYCSKSIISNIVFFFLEILQSHTFLRSRNSKRKVFNGTESNGLNLLSQIRGIVENGLGHLFITSSSSHFFNKTDLELYISEVVLLKSVGTAEIGFIEEMRTT